MRGQEAKVCLAAVDSTEEENSWSVLNLCSLLTQRFPHQLWTAWTGGSVISSAGAWHEARETIFSEQTLVPAKEEIMIRGAAEQRRCEVQDELDQAESRLQQRALVRTLASS